MSEKKDFAKEVVNSIDEDQFGERSETRSIFWQVDTSNRLEEADCEFVLVGLSLNRMQNSAR